MGKKTSAQTVSVRERARIVQAVKTPLGFFVLALLVAESTLIAIWDLGGRNAPGYVYAAISLIFVLIGIVSFFALYRPEALYGKRPAIEVGTPQIAQQQPLTASPVSDDLIIEKNKCQILFCRSRYATEQRWPPNNLGYLLREWFGASGITDLSNMSSRELTKVIMERTFDLIHIEAPVAGNDLYFSENDVLSGDAFANLVDISSAKIVVLPSCNSFTLASKLSSKIVVIAASGTVYYDAAELWAPTFYQLLGRGMDLKTALQKTQGMAGPRINIGAFHVREYRIT